mmetsp:Transcript_28195/g.55209  ORF Transcript_28195/g.55209 Transcript_28195/m.55209 type:complete len:116 (+) Transcript_28195:1528-1875(+)
MCLTLSSVGVSSPTHGEERERKTQKGAKKKIKPTEGGAERKNEIEMKVSCVVVRQPGTRSETEKKKRKREGDRKKGTDEERKSGGEKRWSKKILRLWRTFCFTFFYFPPPSKPSF